VNPPSDALGLLARAPFFEGVGDEHLRHFADRASVESFAPGEAIIREGEVASRLFLLVAGSFDLSFHPSRRPQMDEEHNAPGRSVPRHVVHHPGQPLGWSTVIEPHRYRATAIALEPTRMLALGREVLDEYARERPDFGIAFMQRILSHVGTQLRATRMRLVARRYDDEIRSIRGLLEQAAPELSVTSALYKIPHYLASRLTVGDAFSALECMREEGSAVEADFAGLFLDVLDGVRRELRIYQHLQRIYELVASAPAAAGPAEVRLSSLEEFAALFSENPHRIVGRELLPAEPGQLFVMNHVANHPDNYLPNDFILTLDSHFVSSMLLLPHYGDAPIRVVRKSRPDEYGHQRFYDRLGYIYVYSGHVDSAGADPLSSPEERRRLFFDTAAGHLRARRNVVICPEGTSAATQDSPRPFRAGAFRLAAYARPEPLVVPIAVAHFDRKLTEATPVAVVHEPLRLSDHVPPGDDGALVEWLNGELHPRYERWVREAAAIGA
jgi:CRP-like cAMP-binding protein